MMGVELSAEGLAEETEVLGQRLPSFLFIHFNSHMI
jgi:hypothetical protein